MAGSDEQGEAPVLVALGGQAAMSRRQTLRDLARVAELTAIAAWPLAAGITLIVVGIFLLTI
jgi:hypothetical protein